MTVSFAGGGVLGDSMGGNSNSELLLLLWSKEGLKVKLGLAPVSKLSTLGGIVKLPAPRS
jgi:hypothetical protein